MAKNLRKFVNLKFLKTVDLGLLRQLFDRQPGAVELIDQVFAGKPEQVRQQLTALFVGPEDALPQGLVADLHRIGELGTEQGMTLLQGRAQRIGAVIALSIDQDCVALPIDAKHFALLAFLEHPSIFDAASDLMALGLSTSLAEYAGPDEDVEARMDASSQSRFKAAAQDLFRQGHQGRYCRIGWYDDGGELTLIVTHGAAVTLRPVIEGDDENVISYRAAEHAVLCYHAPSGRLKVGGVVQAHRAELAEIFAQTILERPGFFRGAASQRLYTLAPVETRGLPFQIDHAFDPDIVRVQVTEVQIDRVGSGDQPDNPTIMHSLVVKDNRSDAGAALRTFVPHGITFGPNHYRVGHIVMRVHFKVRQGRSAKVTIKLKPPSQAVFKRHRFEEKIMQLLQRNGFCHDRDASQALAAAE